MRDARYWEYVAKYVAYTLMGMPTAPFVHICADLEKQVDAARQDEAKQKLGVK